MEEAAIKNPTSFQSVKKCFDLLEEGEKTIQIGQKEAILVLGNTGSGKTTLVQFLAGAQNELVAEEAALDSGDFVIVDKKNKISSTSSTMVSKTIFPELTIDGESKVAYYDCPGFDDTRGAAIDIAGTYFIRKVINSLEKVKIILTVNYSSVRQGLDRGDFVEMIRHTLNLVKNIEKYYDSIALMVTKVDNSYRQTKNKNKSKEKELVSDDVVRAYVAKFLQMFKENVAKVITDPVQSAKAINLADALLAKKGTNYERIGLFRRPDEEGPISQNELLKEGRTFIKTMLSERIRYASIRLDDFGYAISDRSKNEVNDMVAEIDKIVKIHLTEICNELEKSIEKKHQQSVDIRQFDKFLSDVEGKMKIFHNEVQYEENLKNFIVKFLNLITRLRVNASGQNFATILKQEKYLDFLELVSERKLDGSSIKWKEGLRPFSHYLDEMREWYSFLGRLYQHLSSYKIQKSKSSFGYLTDHVIDSLNDAKFKKFLESQPDFKLTDRLQAFELDNNKIFTLNKVITSALNTTVSMEYDDEAKAVFVKGDYILLSELKVNDLWSKNVVGIFASNKVFIDANITRSAASELTNFAVVAPTWEIIGAENLILDGQNGSPWDYNQSHGTDGRPGKPGKPGANFFGLGMNFVNSENLRLSTNGGQGGSGQNGGDGEAGYDGKSPRIEYADGSCEVHDMDWFNWNHKSGLISRHYCSYGQPGGDGGDGGDGGTGGFGGHPGNVYLIGVHEQKPTILVDKRIGSAGRLGAGGKTGVGGKAGKSMNTKGFLFWWETISCSESERLARKKGSCATEDYQRNGKPGKAGITGLVTQPIYLPEVPKQPENGAIVKKFKEFIRYRLILDTVNPSEKVEFLSALSKNRQITQFFTTSNLASDFIELENDYSSFSGENFDWLPLYEQLLQMVEANLNVTNDDVQKLKCLQTAVLSKLCMLKATPTRNIDAHVSEYLNTVVAELNYFQKNESQLIVCEIHKKLLDNLKETAKKIDDNVITYGEKISTMTKIVGEKVKKVLVEMVAQGADGATATEKQTSLESNLILLKILHSVQETYQFIGVMAAIGAEIANTPRAPNKYEITDATRYAGTVSKIEKSLLKACHVEIAALLEQFSSIRDSTQIPADVKNLLSNLENSAKNSPQSLDASFKIRKNLQNLLKTINADEDAEKLETAQNILQTIEAILHVKDATIFQIDDKIFSSTHAQVLGATIRKSNFYSHLKLYAQELRLTVEKYFSNLSSSHILDQLIDVSRVPTKRTFDDVSLLLQQLQKGIKLPTDLTPVLETLHMDLDTVSAMYDFLSYFQELDRFVAAAGYSNTDSTSSPFSSTNLEVGTLKAITVSNLAQTRYRVMVKNLNRIVFPFGQIYTDKFNLCCENIKNLTNFAIRKIQVVKSDVDSKGLYLDSDYAKLVFGGEFNNLENSLGAFYLWRNKDHRQVIKDLLAGREVILKADIINAPPKDAVKFTSIGIKFVCRDESLQGQLEEDLSSFEVSMVHGGKSYYRCGNQFYSFTFDEQSLAYSYRKQLNGEPVYKNSLYDKIKSQATFLSPYTRWRIQLKGNNFEKLSKYGDFVDVELEGHGKWLKDGEEICESDLEKYYTPDETIFETNAVEDDVIDLTNLQLRAEKLIENSSNFESRRIPRSVYVPKFDVEEPGITIFNKMTENLTDENVPKIFKIGNTDYNHTDITTSQQPYALNESLLLLDLLVRRVTNEKPKYLANCSTDFLKVRFCALDLVKNFENIMESVSDYPGQFDIEPISLMEQLENDIIKENGKNVGQILLNSVQGDNSSMKDKFYHHLADKIKKQVESFHN